MKEKKNHKAGKGQIDCYSLTSGDGNVSQKIRFPKGRDSDLYRAMLVCNQNKKLTLQTLMNYDKHISFFFFFLSKKNLGFLIPDLFWINDSGHYSFN